MSKRILAVNADGSSAYIRREEAEREVEEQRAQWGGDSCIRRVSLGRRISSAKFGKYLAEASRKGEPWAAVALADMAVPTDRPAFLRS